MQRQFLSLRDRASEIKRLVASPEVIPVAVAVDRSAKSRRPPKVGGPIPRPFSETSPGPRLWRGPRQRAARRQRQKERRKGLAPLVHSKRPETGRELQTATPRQRSASDYRPPRPFTELAATHDVPITSRQRSEGAIYRKRSSLRDGTDSPRDSTDHQSAMTKVVGLLDGCAEYEHKRDRRCRRPPAQIRT